MIRKPHSLICFGIGGKLVTTSFQKSTLQFNNYVY